MSKKILQALCDIAHTAAYQIGKCTNPCTHVFAIPPYRDDMFKCFCLSYASLSQK